MEFIDKSSRKRLPRPAGADSVSRAVKLDGSVADQAAAAVRLLRRPSTPRPVRPEISSQTPAGSGTVGPGPPSPAGKSYVSTPVLLSSQEPKRPPAAYWVSVESEAALVAAKCQNCRAVPIAPDTSTPNVIGSEPRP